MIGLKNKVQDGAWFTTGDFNSIREEDERFDGVMGMKLIWILDYTSQIWLIILTLVVFVLGVTKGRLMSTLQKRWME